MKKTIDVRGLPCPKPVLEVKKAIESSKGEFEVLTNAVESKENILRFLQSQSIKAEVVENEEGFVITFRTEGEVKVSEESSVEHYSCGVKSGKSIVISKNRLGEGDENLGQLLIRSFFQALSEFSPQPQRIFFVNSGVFLTLKNSPVLEELKKMESNGIKIYSCGTCLDYYNVKPELGVGEIGNMYLLVEILMGDGVII